MKYKVLLLGAGYWGKKWLATIASNHRCEFAGVAGMEDELAFAKQEYKLDEKILFTDFREAIKNTKADIAIIVIPAMLHFEAASIALAQNMNVITEKPLATDLEEAVKLVELKSKYPDLKFMVSQNYRWRPHNQAIKKAIEEGMIGDLQNILVTFRQHEHLMGFRAGLEQPGLQDMCIHHFDLVRFFTSSNCKDIYCKTNRPSYSIFEGQPNTDAILTMENGVVVNYNGSWAARGKETAWDGSFLITGSKGCLFFDDEDIYFYPSNVDAAGHFSVHKGELLAKPVMEHTDMAYGLNMFMDCVEDDSIPETDLNDNFQSFKMVCCGRESTSKQALIQL